MEAGTVRYCGREGGFPAVGRYTFGVTDVVIEVIQHIHGANIALERTASPLHGYRAGETIPLMGRGDRHVRAIRYSYCNPHIVGVAFQAAERHVDSGMVRGGTANLN